MLINNYKTVYKITWDVTAEEHEKGMIIWKKKKKLKRKKPTQKKSLGRGLVIGDKVWSLRGRAGRQPVETSLQSQWWTLDWDQFCTEEHVCGRWLILRCVDDWANGGLSADADSTTHMSLFWTFLWPVKKLFTKTVHLKMSSQSV